MNEETEEEEQLMWAVSKIPMFSNRENLLRTRFFWREKNKSMMFI